MFGQMQDWDLRVSHILDHAAKYHANRSIISRSIEGPMVESTWAEVSANAKRVAQALVKLGVKPLDTLGVMAWNTGRHMEVWYGVSGAGAVLHTLNPRLFADQLEYIVNHANDRFLIIDVDLIPVIEALMPRVPKVERVIIMTDRANIPETTIPNVMSYDELLGLVDGDFDWVTGDETDPCGICYTSGTTGNPKGVVYTHRSNVLHAMAVLPQDLVGLSCQDIVMPVVPLFHANGWALAYTAPMAGAALRMPGRMLTPEGLYEMLEMGTTITAAVPTLWLGLLQHMRANDLKLSTLKRVIIGGSSCPRAVIEAFQNDYGVQVIHAWGMTETSPLGTGASFKPEVAALPPEKRLDVQEKVGHPPFTVDLRITDDDGNELPWDDEAQGRLWIRGPGVVKRYHHADGLAVDDENWFDTGDVATMDENAYVRITDRSKDVIKSGGEWISSIDLENAAVAHPEVAEAAAIGVPHPKWDERPVLVVVKAPGGDPKKDDILKLVAGKFAKWQVPDDVIYMDEIPHTATGKISKLELRKQLEAMNYKLPDQAA